MFSISELLFLTLPTFGLPRLAIILAAPQGRTSSAGGVGFAGLSHRWSWPSATSLVGIDIRVRWDCRHFQLPNRSSRPGWHIAEPRMFRLP